MIPQHLSNSVDHFTPAFVVEAARFVLGGIDLDPASCAKAQETVKAGRWFGGFQDGLGKKWKGKVFLTRCSPSLGGALSPPEISTPPAAPVVWRCVAGVRGVFVRARTAFLAWNRAAQVLGVEPSRVEVAIVEEPEGVEVLEVEGG